jgi:hypothetical protein
MTVLRSFHATRAHTGRHWAARDSSLEINRGHVLGLVLALVLSLLLLNMITSTPVDEAVDEPSAGTSGFRGLPVSEDLSLEDTAKNYEYYRILTSVCHNRGQDRASSAYAYLFHASNRYAQNGLWSVQMFDMAVDSVARSGYFGIDPAVDCDPATGNFHGLDLDSDLALQANAMNYVFFSRKVDICRQAGNEIQARSYRFHAGEQLDKAYNGRRPDAVIRDAIRGAETSPDIPQIHGC